MYHTSVCSIIAWKRRGVSPKSLLCFWWSMTQCQYGTWIFETPHSWNAETDSGVEQNTLFFGRLRGAIQKQVQFHQHRAHATDFGITCEWHFATSHGKSACDGIGGTVKRATAKESLRRPYTGHIMKAQSMFVFLAEKFETAIQFFLVEKEEVRKGDRPFLRCQNYHRNWAVSFIYPSGWRAPDGSRPISRARQSSWH